MGTLRKRLRRLEKEAGFRRWLDFSRLLENLSDSQVEEIAIYFRFPDPMPEPLPFVTSKLDGLDRKTQFLQHANRGRSMCPTTSSSVTPARKRSQRS
jgi:hypothetical protein